MASAEPARWWSLPPCATRAAPRRPRPSAAAETRPATRPFPSAPPPARRPVGSFRQNKHGWPRGPGHRHRRVQGAATAKRETDFDWRALFPVPRPPSGGSDRACATGKRPKPAPNPQFAAAVRDRDRRLRRALCRRVLGRSRRRAAGAAARLARQLLRALPPLVAEFRSRAPTKHHITVPSLPGHAFSATPTDRGAVGLRRGRRRYRRLGN